MDDLTPYPSRSSSVAGRSDQRASSRVGELERAAACDALADHFAAGRLDPAELDDRLARAMTARSRDDLRVLFADLGPRRRVPSPVSPAPAEQPGRSLAMPAAAGSVLVLALLVAGGLLLVLGAYQPLLFVAAVVGGLATGVAGVCATVLVQWLRR